MKTACFGKSSSTIWGCRLLFSSVCGFSDRHYLRHPDFRSVGDGNDIAFILLDEAVDDITPVNIDWREMTDDEVESTKPVVNACGWGRMKAREDVYPKRLQCTQLNLLSGRLCNDLYNPYKELGLISHSDSELCASVSDYKKDTCYGDSGGPLFQIRMNSQTSKMEAYLVAIVSHGDRCAKREKPGVYVRLSHFEHFGRCILEDGLECDYVSNFLTKHQKNKLKGGFLRASP
ncbi:S1 family serine peptidase [Endozoicomonas montiporae]|uniref:S1 family serine peptidase n=1 Tax=Endozoicomonas montiporae TaxID=1027273 RepID=UPI001F2ABC3C|nr:serine protease [Endozoicomonas montiporae]